MNNTCNRFEIWSKELFSLTPAIRNHHPDALRLVLEAALNFCLIESQDGPTHASEFDHYLHAARSVPFGKHYTSEIVRWQDLSKLKRNAIH